MEITGKENGYYSQPVKIEVTGIGGAGFGVGGLFIAIGLMCAAQILAEAITKLHS